MAYRRALGRRDHAGAARVGRQRHAQRAREGLEHRLALVVRVVALQVVDVQRDAARGWRNPGRTRRSSWVSKPPIMPALKGTSHVQPGAAGEVDHHARQRLVQRHIGVAVARDAASCRPPPAPPPAQRDADVLDRVVAVDVQVALGLDRRGRSGRGGRSGRACGRRSRCRWPAWPAPLPSRSSATRICVSLVSRRMFGGAVRSQRLAFRASIIAVVFLRACRRSGAGSWPAAGAGRRCA